MQDFKTCRIETTMRLFAVSCFALAGALAQANLILNGEFETVAPDVGTAPRKAAGSSELTSWTIVGQAILHIHHQYAEPGNGIAAFNAHSGIASIDLTGASNEGLTTGVKQTVSTVVGQEYLLLFWVGAARSSIGASVYSSQSIVDLSINGGPRVSYFNDQETPTGQAIWLPRYASFTASSTSTEVAFYNGTELTTNNFVGLDSVEMFLAPEPATVIMLGAGLLASSRKRRK